MFVFVVFRVENSQRGSLQVLGADSGRLLATLCQRKFPHYPFMTCDMSPVSRDVTPSVLCGMSTIIICVPLRTSKMRHFSENCFICCCAANLYYYLCSSFIQEEKKSDFTWTSWCFFVFVTGSITHNEGPEYSKKLLVLTKLSTFLVSKNKSTTRTFCNRRFTYPKRAVFGH